MQLLNGLPSNYQNVPQSFTVLLLWPKLWKCEAVICQRKLYIRQNYIVCDTNEQCDFRKETSKNFVPAVYMISQLPFHNVKTLRVCPHCIGQCWVRTYQELSSRPGTHTCVVECSCGEACHTWSASTSSWKVLYNPWIYTLVIQTFPQIIWDLLN